MSPVQEIPPRAFSPGTGATRSAAPARGARSARLAVLLALTLVGVGSRGRADTPAVEAGRDVPEAEERLRELLEGREPILQILPLDRLESVEVEERAVRLRFDFGRQRRLKVRLPDLELWVQGDSPDELLLVRIPGRTLSIDREVRLETDERGLSGVGRGDVKVCWGPLRFDLALRVEHQADRVVRDGEGRAVILTDPDGNVVVRDGKPVPMRADEWLVVEVRGRRFDLPLDPR